MNTYHVHDLIMLSTWTMLLGFGVGVIAGFWYSETNKERPILQCLYFALVVILTILVGAYIIWPLGIYLLDKTKFYLF